MVLSSDNSKERRRGKNTRAYQFDTGVILGDHIALRGMGYLWPL